MGPEVPLPLPEGYKDVDNYIEDLLQFVTHSHLLNLLCGGVHILDFFTCLPDLYERIFDEEWRNWFALHSMENIMDFILREDLELVNKFETWQGQPRPPDTLLAYLSNIRRLTLRRDVALAKDIQCARISRQLAVGMNVKKIHEVGQFASYVHNLTSDIAASSSSRKMSHLVDFGAGKNYLGRVLASSPYNRHIVAVEGRPNNVKGAKHFDVSARLAPKAGIMRNKKLYRAQLNAKVGQERDGESVESVLLANEVHPGTLPVAKDINSVDNIEAAILEPSNESRDSKDVQNRRFTQLKSSIDDMIDGNGSIQHVVQQLQDGNLSKVVREMKVDSSCPSTSLAPEVCPKLMVISLHSCGNLSHHGLRSMVLNPSVAAVALIGCCYNLVTERFAAEVSYKHPSLRSSAGAIHDDAYKTRPRGDEHGFPMSALLARYPTPSGRGIHLNITARMMAVQAPQNWGANDSDSFFTRNFYRALLQKVFLDRGIVSPMAMPEDECCDMPDSQKGHSAAGCSNGPTQPIIIGSLRKACYKDFPSYVSGAQARIVKDPERGAFFADRMAGFSDEDATNYAQRYATRKKDLSVVWTLMAYSAGLFEATIVIDRWLWLREQEQVGECWVENVFDYAQSPRNLVVVGIKK